MTGFDADQSQRRESLAVIAEGSEFHPRFHDWLLTHFGIYEAFESAADKVAKRGHQAYSAFVIVNVLRWRADSEGTKFAMSNTMVPDLARLYNKVRFPLFKISTRFSTKG